MKSGKPLALKTIKFLIKNIDRVTLFRVLAVFEKNKILHIINLEDGQRLYALCSQDCVNDKSAHTHAHIHFKCDDCNDVSCLPINKFPQLSVPEYLINDVSINASGLCINCKN